MKKNENYKVKELENNKKKFTVQICQTVLVVSGKV